MYKNAKSLPEVYYGLHMVPGVAEYAEPEKEPYRILIEENTIKNMDPTFKGKPVYVDHVDQVNLARLQEEADGYVIRSFYNELDGKHWVEFIVVSDKGKSAIRNGWKLSNAYIPKSFRNGGLWHGVEYSQEVMNGEYEHLAIVKNPRYEESIILTPDQFKNYNDEKETELKRLANSKDKGEKKMGLNFFKRSKVENSVDLETTVVTLPKSKKELTILEIVNQLDAVHNMHGYANDEHMVKCGENEMSVKDLVKKHMENEAKLSKMEQAKTEDGGEPGPDADMKNDEEYGEELEAKQLDRGGDKSLENKEDEEKDEMKKNEIKKKVAALKNAGPSSDNKSTFRVDLASDKIARGKSRYGSN